MMNLEEAFRLIEEGNNATDLWNKADLFCQAHSILKQLATEQPKDSEEHERVAKLYQQQSNEYLHRSRDALLQAMKDEDSKDRNQQQQQQQSHHHHQSLSDTQAEQRLALFSTLFCREIETASTQSKKERPMLEKQSSIEERLMELNKSLPKGFKTSQERMNDINRGLGRLGLSLYSHSEAAQNNNVELPKSETEQVHDIIAQAKDEVAIQGTENKNNNVEVDSDDDSTVDDEKSSSVDDDASSSDKDKDLSPDIINEIQEKVVDAQAKLAVLVSLLDLDQDQQAEIEFDQATGRKALKDARRLLKQAAAKWETDE